MVPGALTVCEVGLACENGRRELAVKLRRFWIVFGGACLLIILLFVAFEQAGMSLSLDDHAVSGTRAVAAAALGVALLVIDVLLPVPSSVVMLAHGALFGVALGALLSIAGATGAALFGCGLGRLGQAAFRRYITPAEHARAAALLDRFGLLAIAITRPVPVLAEAVAIIAGASGYGFVRTAVAAVIGTAPAAFAYAWAGSQRLNAINDALIFALVLLLSAALWLVGRGRQLAPERD
jgi:uncharacterized membrane protein YdjX (TVP38/TMEM64 family)